MTSELSIEMSAYASPRRYSTVSPVSALRLTFCPVSPEMSRLPLVTLTDSVVTVEAPLTERLPLETAALLAVSVESATVTLPSTVTFCVTLSADPPSAVTEPEPLMR